MIDRLLALLACLSLAFVFGIAGCSEDSSPADDAAEAVEDAAEAGEEAAEDAGEALEDAGAAAEDAFNDATN